MVSILKKTFFEKNTQLQGKLIDLNEPKIMGILNITPDSFYDKVDLAQIMTYSIE